MKTVDDARGSRAQQPRQHMLHRSATDVIMLDIATDDATRSSRGWTCRLRTGSAAWTRLFAFCKRALSVLYRRPVVVILDPSSQQPVSQQHLDVIIVTLTDPGCYRRPVERRVAPDNVESEDAVWVVEVTASVDLPDNMNWYFRQVLTSYRIVFDRLDVHFRAKFVVPAPEEVTWLVCLTCVSSFSFFLCDVRGGFRLTDRAGTTRIFRTMPAESHLTNQRRMPLGDARVSLSMLQPRRLKHFVFVHQALTCPSLNRRVAVQQDAEPENRKLTAIGGSTNDKMMYVPTFSCTATRHRRRMIPGIISCQDAVNGMCQIHLNVLIIVPTSIEIHARVTEGNYVRYGKAD